MLHRQVDIAFAVRIVKPTAVMELTVRFFSVLPFAAAGPHSRSAYPREAASGQSSRVPSSPSLGGENLLHSATIGGPCRGLPLHGSKGCRE